MAAKVFISHAGEQKKVFVDVLHSFLEIEGISSFVDEYDLVPGDKNWPAIEKALKEATVVVLVLTKDFMRKESPMRELAITLEERKNCPGRQQILPVYLDFPFGLNYEEMYTNMTWPDGRPDSSNLKAWAENLSKVSKISGLRPDQFNYFYGRLGIYARDRVINMLKAAGELVRDYRAKGQLAPPMRLCPVAGSFIGREKEVQEVTESLLDKGAAVIWGSPGEGKSSVARKAGEVLWLGDKAYGGCFEIDLLGLQSHDDLQEFIARQLVPELKQTLGGVDFAAADTWTTVINWVWTKDPKSVLLLFENAESAIARDNDLRQKFQALLEDLQRRHVIVLVTSRAAPTSGLGGAKVLRLQCLPEDKSVELLIDRCSEVAWLPGQAEELATRCCHKNAFAITLIGAQLNNKRCLPQDALECASVSELAKMSRTEGDLSAKVSQLWLQKYLAPEERADIAALSVFGGSFDAAAASAVMGPTGRDAKRLMLDLHSLAIISRLPNQSRRSAQAVRYTMHPLIREFAAQLLAQHAQEVQVAVRVRFVAHIFSRGNQFQKLKVDSSTLAAALELLSDESSNFSELPIVLSDKQVADISKVTALLCNEQGRALFDRGQLQLAEAYHMRALEIAERRLEADAPEIAEISHDLALLLWRRGFLDGAERHIKRSLEIRKQHAEPGKYSAEVVSSMESLAVVLSSGAAQEQLFEAEDLYRTVLRMQQDELGEYAPSVATTCNNLATMLERQGKTKEAEELFLQALTIHQRSGHDVSANLAVAFIQNNLASIAAKRGELSEAQEKFRQVISITEAALGKDHINLVNVYNNLARSLQDEGKLEKVPELLQNALRIQQMCLGSRHPSVAQMCRDLADVLQQLKKLRDAEKYFRQAVAVHEQVHGNNHPDVAASLNRLARMLVEQGRLGEAEREFRKAFAVGEGFSGSQRSIFADTCGGLGKVLYCQARDLRAQAKVSHSEGHFLQFQAQELQCQNRLAEALSYHQQDLSVMESLRGLDHTELAQVLMELASILSDQECWEDAEQLLVRASEMKSLEGEPELAASVHAKLGGLLQDQDKLLRAEEQYKLALCTGLAENHPRHVATCTKLANVLARQEKYAEAEPYYRRAIQMLHSSPGGVSPVVVLVYGSLASVVQQQGPARAAEAQQLRDKAKAIGDAARQAQAKHTAGQVPERAVVPPERESSCCGC